MLIVERREKIKQILEKEKKIDIYSLTELLGVSDVTVRKDLDKLQKEGFLKKIHGGAVLVENQEKSYVKNYEYISNLHLKEKIAKAAYKTIKKGESIFIGSGTTCYLLAQQIKKEDKISVVTNNISTLDALIPNCTNVILIGGEVVSENGTLYTLGKMFSNNMEGIYVNKAFTSVTGVDLNAGLTVTKDFSAYIYRHILKITNNWTLMIDSSKYNKIGLVYVSPIDSPNVIITNKIDEEYKSVFDKKGKQVLICEE